MFFGCCCSTFAKGGAGANSVAKDAPISHYVEELDAPVAAWRPPATGTGDAPKESGGAAPGSTFTASIVRRPGAPIGLNIDLSDGVSAVIVEVKDGVVSAYNAEMPERALRVHDRIVEVGGARGDASSIASKLKTEMSWSLVVQRPIEFVVSISRVDGRKMGMELQYSQSGNTLLVMSVGDGFIQDWNARHPDKVVCKDDRIVRLNEIFCDPLKMLEASKDLDTLHLTFIRYPSFGPV
mmetsp:Transcript_126210/g.353459  ORF Transcript_126210/g.353459 Transcript_126210/m.353459 type:complete len:238 (-) Transcript_126210:143-856(-)|eukprot:CAMPEP_0176192328 /NCGR_PEP_ID=MMETSP0121_2-20121125/4916_1 /TAXON_ID=160619 /ORGANISM="Kryptoperidinium foliaceum, Strain CCMP 1326" /LENGTH=237 /DNA_ID=CAMNT_0017531015 /DNA_START=120 /DNA_END=833 /DNA_ORIENTATION=+